MERQNDSKLVLADGSVFEGVSFGAKKEVICEIVFNTSMVGYQEIITDPSYTDQGVVMSYPLIGNYGINNEDNESDQPSLSALIVRNMNDAPSNFRSTNSLSEILAYADIAGLSGIDTRRLVHRIRDHGSCLGIICDIALANEEALEKIGNYEVPHDAVSRVSCKNVRKFRTKHAKYHVVAIDCGIKMNIIRCLNELGCDVTLVPYNTDPETIQKMNPDGVFISNGPGDPEDNIATIHTIRELKGKYPMFGICLGHQMIALAYGARTYKLKFGHRGGNHPVRNLVTDRIDITSQNHSYAVDEKSLENTSLHVTHLNILDNTVEGMACEEDRIFSVQYHPESAPGPMDSYHLFDQFMEMMEEKKHAEKK